MSQSLPPSFWDDRYARAQIPWDAGSVPSRLAEFLRHERPGRVLIPGCGSGYEIAAFHSHGWKVKAVDFSSEALKRAKKILGPVSSCITLGDFFSQSFKPGSFDLVYERTFLCAIDPSQRPAYADTISRVLGPSGCLAGFFFVGPESDPPPHPISIEDAQILLRGFHLTAQEAVTDSLPMFREKERWLEWLKAPQIPA